jgi:hypothetical protein
MGWFKAGAATAAAAAALVGASLVPPATSAGAADSAEAARPRKSVYGKLVSVDKTRGSVVMQADGGDKLSWRFAPAVIAEAVQFKAGDPMIVIYRQMSASEKRVTALAFPGSAATPIYVNTTGGRILVRSSAMADGVCQPSDSVAISDYTIPAGGLAEVREGCWCCAPSGESCTPGNKSGNGRALLVSCFQ